MNSFVMRLSNVIAWSGFTCMITITCIAILNGKDVLINEDSYREFKQGCLESHGLTDLFKSEDSYSGVVEVISEEDKRQWLKCLNEHKTVKVTYDFKGLLDWLLFIPLFYIPYVMIVVANYLMVGRFRLLPWKKLKDSQDN